ncbi:DUF3108 domain-containing protein [Herbaspirillum sp. RV1423]|uniref:DUF3108 domain-containing protein n=1 Tax=Herbaspirillum sp. RV1423 TaxID=1443993 RepID=UPI0004B7C06C|nr:DUF3108 domain-containing protein [Herbaspirillum sp. RV1423]
MTEAKAFPLSRPWRAAALVLLTVLLHLLAIDWGKEYFNAATADQRAQSSISVALRPVELPKQQVSLPTAAPPKVRKARKPAPVPAPSIAPATPSDEIQPVTTAPAAEPPAAADGNDAGAAAADATDAKNAPSPKDDSKTPETQGTHYQIDPPPSAELEYEVRAFSDNLNWYGTSILTWKTDGSRYRVDGEVYTRLFAKIGFLNFSSTGDINEFGVAPELYTEKKRNRPATNTHFNRERNVVSFSASTANYPRVGGEQDRASLIWQLAGIGRGDNGKFTPGAVIDMFVAGVRDGEVWRMQVVGQEEIHLTTGAAQVWHVVRQPRPGSYDQRLDIWLEPGRQWYPARLRFTETNGDYLELSLSNLKAL